MQESEFQTIATETVRVFSGISTNTPLRTAPKYGNQRTFLGEAKIVINVRRYLVRIVECIMEYGIVLILFEEE